MSNIPENNEKKQRPNLINDADINTNNTDDFFSDFNATLVDDLDKSIEKKDIENKKQAKIVEERKKNFKGNIKLIGIIAAIVLVVIILLIIVATVINRGNYTLNLIDSGVIVEQQALFEETENQFLVDTTVEENETSEEVTVSYNGYNIVTLESGDTFQQNDTVLIDLVVNTKESWEENFSDHNTQLLFTYTDSVIGYDNVIEYVNEYNSLETTTNTIVLPSKEDYEASGMDLVMIEFEVAYPENYPTYNSDGKVFKIPSLSMEIKGLCEDLLIDETELDKPLDSYIVVNEFIYELNSIIGLNNDVDEVNKNETVTYRFITSLPYNTLGMLYELKLTLSIDGQTYVYNVDTVDTTVVLESISDNSVDDLSNTEETDSTTEETAVDASDESVKESE